MALGCLVVWHLAITSAWVLLRLIDGYSTLVWQYGNMAVLVNRYMYMGICKQA